MLDLTRNWFILHVIKISFFPLHKLFQRQFSPASDYKVLIFFLSSLSTFQNLTQWEIVPLLEITYSCVKQMILVVFQIKHNNFFQVTEI